MDEDLSNVLDAIESRIDDIFVVVLDDLEVPFCLPSVKTAQQFAYILSITTTSADRNFIYETIFRTCVTDDWIADKAPNIPAGVPETVAKLILFLSGVDENYIEYTKQLLEVNRSNSNSILGFMKRVICRTFGGYTFESLDKLNYQQIIYNFVEAESVLLEGPTLEGPESGIKQRFDFFNTKKGKAKPSDMIKSELEAYKNFEQMPNPKQVQQANKLKQAMIKKAQQEEAQFKRQMVNQNKPNR